MFYILLLVIFFSILDIDHVKSNKHSLPLLLSVHPYCKLVKLGWYVWCVQSHGETDLLHFTVSTIYKWLGKRHDLQFSQGGRMC